MLKNSVGQKFVGALQRNARAGLLDCTRCRRPLGIFGKIYWLLFGCNGDAFCPPACHQWHQRQGDRIGHD